MTYATVRTDAEVDIDVIVKGPNGNELSRAEYDVDTSYGEIEITLNKMVPVEPKESKVLQRVKQIATEQCPDFIPHLEQLERELQMEHLRPRD